MKDYYADKLSASRLKQCYDIAPLRIQQYLIAELDYVCQHMNSSDTVLELGCGYGRILPEISKKANYVFGIDTSFSSLLMGQKNLRSISNCHLLKMDAVNLAFRDQCFDVLVCIQNGISAFHADKERIIQESVRVTKKGGIILFSSYSENFWNYRLEWFYLQAKAGLLGRIDKDKTKDGVIVCEDGFTATTVDGGEFRSLSSKFDVNSRIIEVDNSSLFCEMIPF